MNKYGIVALVVLAALSAGSYFYANTLFGEAKALLTSFGSPTGSSVQNAKFFGKVANLANTGANGTSTSILNNTGNDQYITQLRIGCENVGTSQTAYTGAGLASLTVTIATSSTAAPATLNPVIRFGIQIIATGTTAYVAASTTASTVATTSLGQIWNSGSYLTFATNATNTATCTFGVDTVSS